MKFTRRNLLCGISVLIMLLTAQAAQKLPSQIKGYVLDSACVFTKNLSKPVSPECAVSCAKAGSPLVILADNGYIYWPIADSMPATGQNDRLIKFAGQKIVATGKVFIRSGSRAIVIEKIEAAPAK